MRWIEGGVSAAVILFVLYLTIFSTQISRVGMVQSYGWPFDSLLSTVLVCTPVAAVVFWIGSRPKRF